MKKTGFILLVLFLLSLACAPAAAEEAGAEPDEWTVLFYICGSDLESEYGYASGMLRDIGETYGPAFLAQTFQDEYSRDAGQPDKRKPGGVNVLIETGGSKAWHLEKGNVIGIEADTGTLQRWRFRTDSESDALTGELMQTLPLQSMGAPETLADFIRWGTETYPAKKYALVLWGHGEGAMTGLFIDELFSKDVMYLYELRQALADGGAQFEALVIDACLMANIETAWNIKDYARWMVASEETVPGKGTAVGSWLQELFAYPECDGEWLGRCICDTTGIQYGNSGDEQAKSLLTWSVTDLSKIERLVQACEDFFRMISDTLVKYPSRVRMYISCIFYAEGYGEGRQNMRDLGAVIYNRQAIYHVDRQIRGEMTDALSDAVVYIVRGPGRSAARGLSFCYPADFSEEKLDIYARNCPMPRYLAFIDAISPWTAPDWVYEHTRRLPNIDDVEELKITPVRVTAGDGMPGLIFGPSGVNVQRVFYRLYRLDEEKNEIIRLGRTACGLEIDDASEEILYRATDPMHWPAVDGELCCIDMIQDNQTTRLYNIPVQINSRICILRCGRKILYSGTENGGTAGRTSEYEIYGVWEQYDEDSQLMNRSVKPLAMFSGREYRLLYPLDDDNGKEYSYGKTMTLRRVLDVGEIPLPAGTYYLEYEIEDAFMKRRMTERIEIHWDGTEMTFPEGFSWNGIINHSILVN